MRGLVKHEEDQRRHHYLKSAAECTSRAVVSLELADEPVKSVKQARRLEGVSLHHFSGLYLFAIFGNATNTV